MLVYNFECQSCGETTEHLVPYEARLTSVDCPECGEKESAEYRISAPLVGMPRKGKDFRAIHSEKQVEDEYGKDWRDQGTTRKPGGAGRKIYFHDK